MLIKDMRLIVVILGTVVVFGQMCIAGTWRDDFSDRSGEDWGPLHIIDEMSDEYSVGIKNGHLNFRGKTDSANLSLNNLKLGKIHDFSLEMKFMIRHLPAPAKEASAWIIHYKAFNGETREHEGMLEFEFRHASPHFFEAQDVAEVWISRGIPEDHPQIGRIWRPEIVAHAQFAYEKEVWRTLKIQTNGNRYILWVDDFGLHLEDESVPSGTIAFQFLGKCNIWLDDFTVAGPTVPDGGPGHLRAVPATDKLTTTWGKLKTRN